jgi:outer membrane protein assembly factor BamB
VDAGNTKETWLSGSDQLLESPGIPILSEVPLGGGLFRNRAGLTRSSLLVMVEPHVIRWANRQTSADGEAGFTLYEMDGSLAWDFPLTDVQLTPAAFYTDRFLLAANATSGSAATLYCLAEPDGELLWSVELSGSVITTPALDTSGRCVVATDGGSISCFEADGSEAWNVSQPVLDSGLMIDSGRLYCCSGANLLILDMLDGDTVGEVSLQGNVDGSTPAAGAGGLIVVGTEDGKLLTVDPAASSPQAELFAQLGAGCCSQPVCDPVGNVVVATVDGAVQCLDAGGNQLWKVDTERAQWLELSVASDGTVYAAGTNGGTYIIGSN